MGVTQVFVMTVECTLRLSQNTWLSGVLHFVRVRLLSLSVE